MGESKRDWLNAGSWVWDRASGWEEEIDEDVDGTQRTRFNRNRALIPATQVGFR